MSNPCQETVQLAAAGPEKSAFCKGASPDIATILQAQKQLESTKGLHILLLVLVCMHFSLHFYFSEKHEVEGGLEELGEGR